MFSIDYGMSGFGLFGFALVGLLVGVVVISAFWMYRAVRGAQHIVHDEDEAVRQPPVQPPVDPHT